MLLAGLRRLLAARRTKAATRHAQPVQITHAWLIRLAPKRRIRDKHGAHNFEMDAYRNKQCAHTNAQPNANAMRTYNCDAHSYATDTRTTATTMQKRCARANVMPAVKQRCDCGSYAYTQAWQRRTQQVARRMCATAICSCTIAMPTTLANLQIANPQTANVQHFS